MRRSSAALTIVVVVVAATALGCGARKEYVASNVDVVRTSWDSLSVAVSFAERHVIGGSEPISPDSTTVTVFDADYNTLFSGSAGVVTVPDTRLGDRERIMVEVCGSVRRRQICVQESLQASPKRLEVGENITYPRRGDVEEGAFDLRFTVERRRFDGDEWERIEPTSIGGHLLAWVNDPEAKERGSVRIPFNSSNGRFSLPRYPNYKNFKYYLESELLDHQSAEVTFDIYAGVGEQRNHLASATKEVHRKTEDEREREVRYFAEQATEMLIDELGSYLGSRRAYAYVEGWTFSTVGRTYEIEVEIEWEGPRFDRGDYEIEGLLDVREDGTDARFRIESGNRRAVRRWRARTDGEMLRLGDLDVYREELAEGF